MCSASMQIAKILVNVMHGLSDCNDKSIIPATHTEIPSAFTFSQNVNTDHIMNVYRRILSTNPVLSLKNKSVLTIYWADSVSLGCKGLL